jgi:hypothetical protein
MESDLAGTEHEHFHAEALSWAHDRGVQGGRRRRMKLALRGRRSRR